MRLDVARRIEGGRGGGVGISEVGMWAEFSRGIMGGGVLKVDLFLFLDLCLLCVERRRYFEVMRTAYCTMVQLFAVNI